MDYSIVIPTLNEVDNLRSLLPEILGPRSEVIVVDDGSTDGTTKLVKEAMSSFNIKLVSGDKKGLTSAILKGIDLASNNIIVVMDGDGQHKPEYIPKLLDYMSSGYDVVVGSRYIKGGSAPGLALWRKLLSKVACNLSYPLLPKVRDNISGFFAIRKEVVTGIRQDVPKILLEVLVRGKYYSVVEVPITFGKRLHGTSKFYSKRTMLNLFRQISNLYLSRAKGFFLYAVLPVSVISLTYPILAGTIGSWGLHILLVSVTAGLTVGVVSAPKLVPSRRRVPSDCDYEWHSWWGGNVFQRYWKRRITNIIISMAGRPGRILELGCGSSPTLNFLGRTGIGVDCDKGKIDFMKGRSPGYISYEVCDLSTPRHLLKYGEFDLIVMNEVIEHLKEPAELLSILPRLLTDKGRLIVATPDYNHKLWLLAEKFTLYKDGHVYKFTRELLEEECLKVGLKPLGYEYVVGCDLVEVFVKT